MKNNNSQIGAYELLLQQKIGLQLNVEQNSFAKSSHLCQESDVQSIIDKRKSATEKCSTSKRRFEMYFLQKKK